MSFKVWQVVKPNIWNSLPLPQVNTSSQHTSLYSLYKRVPTGWERIACNAYPAKIAGRVFSARLAENPLELQIRKIKLVPNEAR